MTIPEKDLEKMAADDLRRLEEDIIGEAEASVEDYDAMGEEGKAAEAAESAAEFAEAARELS